MDYATAAIESDAPTSEVASSIRHASTTTTTAAAWIAVGGGMGIDGLSSGHCGAGGGVVSVDDDGGEGARGDSQQRAHFE